VHNQPCSESVVTDTKDAQPLYDTLLAFYRDVMRLPLPYKVCRAERRSHTQHVHAAVRGRSDPGQFLRN
jgi:hypothetical protein